MFSYLYNIDIKSIPVLSKSSQMPQWEHINAKFDTDYTDLKKSESTNILAVTRSDLQRLRMSQSNPVVNSKARFQPGWGLFFRQASPSLVRSCGDQQHSLTFDSSVWTLLLVTSSHYLERRPTVLLPRSPAPVSSTRCTVLPRVTMCSKGVPWR